MKAIVTGMIGTFPMGGVAWDYCQYAASLEALGFEVYYLEDTGVEGWIINPATGTLEQNDELSAEYLATTLGSFSPSLADRWHLRTESGRTFGLCPRDLHDVVAEADVFVNVSGATLLRDEYRRCRRKIFVDTDPGWNHFVIFQRWDARPEADRRLGFRSHDHFFTFAERFASEDCPLPSFGLTWHATRHPVLPERWPVLPSDGDTYTTLMSWNTYKKPITFGDETYGAKELEFAKIEDVPRSASVKFEVAVHGDAPRRHWESLGWSVVTGDRASSTAAVYHDYVGRSRGELSVAKNVYVATRSGWFSGRSACYLASGRPVIVQDTGFSECLPTGEGLLAFESGQDAAAAIAEVEANYSRHRRRARELAIEYFDGRQVLGQLLSTAGL
jgi:hypothetical protein